MARELRKEQYGGYNYIEYVDGEIVKYHKLNKGEVRRLRDEIEHDNAPKAHAPRGHAGRYVALVKTTTGLHTGKPWIADGFTVDKHSLPPEWEGELVCYVYPA